MRRDSKQQKKKEYFSIEDFEKEFLPALFKKRLAEEKSKHEDVHEIGFAAELLESIRQKLAT